MSAVAMTRHATKHFHATRHPIIGGYDPPEGWGGCYIDEVMLDLSNRATPHNGVARRRRSAVPGGQPDEADMAVIFFRRQGRAQCNATSDIIPTTLLPWSR